MIVREVRIVAVAGGVNVISEPWVVFPDSGGEDEHSDPTGVHIVPVSVDAWLALVGAIQGPEIPRGNAEGASVSRVAVANAAGVGVFAPGALGSRRREEESEGEVQPHCGRRRSCGDGLEERRD